MTDVNNVVFPVPGGLQGMIIRDTKKEDEFMCNVSLILQYINITNKNELSLMKITCKTYPCTKVIVSLFESRKAFAACSCFSFSLGI